MKKLNNIDRLIIKFKMLFIPDGAVGDRARGKLYEPFLKAYDENFKVATGAMIFNPNNLTVGKHVYIGFNAYIGEGTVQLEDEVMIGPFVSITASNHLRKGASYRFGGFKPEEIFIGYGCWIGSHACIMAGVKLKSGSLVAAGAIVTKSFDKNKLIMGIPAIEKKDIDANRKL